MNDLIQVAFVQNDSTLKNQMKANLHIVLEMSYSSQNSQSPNAMRGTSVIR